MAKGDAFTTWGERVGRGDEVRKFQEGSGIYKSAVCDQMDFFNDYGGPMGGN